MYKGFFGDLISVFGMLTGLECDQASCEKPEGFGCDQIPEGEETEDKGCKWKGDGEEAQGMGCDQTSEGEETEDKGCKWKGDGEETKGMGCDQDPEGEEKEGMGCDQDAEGDDSSDAGQNELCEVLRCMFNASDVDYYYED